MLLYSYSYIYPQKIWLYKKFGYIKKLIYNLEDSK